MGEALLRYEVTAKPAAWLKLTGALDARGDTHDQTTWDGVDWQDRGITRPGLSVRRLSGLLSRGPVSLEVGKQFIRWGKTDILNPTDRFAPRDYLAVVDNEFLAVTGARLTAGLQSNTLDLVWARFTPSRTPLLDQRWSGLPREPPGAAARRRRAPTTRAGRRPARAGATSAAASSSRCRASAATTTCR